MNDRRSEVPTSDRRSFWDEPIGDVALPSPAKPCRKLSRISSLVQRQRVTPRTAGTSIPAVLGVTAVVAAPATIFVIHSGCFLKAFERRLTHPRTIADQKSRLLIGDRSGMSQAGTSPSRPPPNRVESFEARISSLVQTTSCYTENSRNFNSGCSRCNSRCRRTSDDIRHTQRPLLKASAA